MKCIIYIAILLLFTNPLPWSQEKGLPILKGEDLLGATVTRVETFKGKALFGYIDGGAELYLEYGFEILGLQEIAIAGDEFTIQIYKMKSPLHAFGIFSINRSKCLPAEQVLRKAGVSVDSLSLYSCLSSHQLQIACSEYYINISNASGSDQTRERMVQFAQRLLRKIKSTKINLPPQFRNTKLALHQQNIKLMYGRLGVQNSFADWEDRFEGFSGYHAYILPIEREKEWIWIALIEFASKSDLKEFSVKQGFSTPPGKTFAQRISGNSRLSLRQLNPTSLIFVEASKDCSKDILSYLKLFE
ncbi:MAG: DUF6599 family protein [bacterium]